MTSAAAVDPARWVRPELREIPPYSLDLTPCRFKLDQNECAWELPAPFKRRVGAALAAADWGLYPDFHGGELRREIALLHDWPLEGVLVGNGSNELLGVALDALGGPGREVMGADPTFGLYRRMIQRSGGIPRFLAPREDLRLPREELLRAIGEVPTRPVLVCSPNNPTGDALAPEEVEGLLRRLDAPLLLDAAYVEFSQYDYRPLLDRYRNLLLFRTFSKAWALGGLRLGYLLADPELVERLLAVKLPYNVGRATVLAGREALRAGPAVRRRVAATVALRSRWRKMLQSHGLEVFDSEANFLLVRCGRPGSPELASTVRCGLEDREVRVRDVGHYPGLVGCLRFSVGSSRALRAVDSALAEVLPGTVSPAPSEGESR